MQGIRRFGEWIVAVTALGCGACGGGGGSGSPAAPAPTPTVTISALPTIVASGSTATLTWSSTDATACSASGGWVGSKAASGSEQSPPLSATATFTITCTGKGGSASQSVTVNLAGTTAPDPPAGVQAATGDGSITVTWQSATGTYYQGFLVSTNVYVSTQPHIDVTTFPQSATNQVMRGLATPHPIVFSAFANGTPLYIVATDVANGVESAASPEITVTPAAIPPLVEHLAALNDTGVTGCTDFTSLNQPCPVSALPNQDADVGRDASARKGLLTKVGFGEGGFDFTKLDENGAPLPASASAWNCIRDNTTGLTWEVPGISGLSSVQNVYSWYQPDATLNGGYAGWQNGGTCTGSDCDTYARVAAVNAANLCGHNDWRLPTRREMLSLVTYAHASPAFDTGAFPNQPNYFNAFYWTSTVHSGTAAVGFGAWIVDVATGKLDIKEKPYIYLEPPLGSIMAVRWVEVSEK